MNWEITHHDPRVVSAFSAYRNFVLGIATHCSGSRLIEQLDLSALGDDLRLSISDDFPEAVTTIRTVGNLRLASMESPSVVEVQLYGALPPDFSLRANVCSGRTGDDCGEGLYFSSSAIPAVEGSLDVGPMPRSLLPLAGWIT